ncbi:MAG: HAMP domain-containing histidine kinase [Ruminococcaceae bacterium]|nr:HAMP domain-containing histidine kinase [Oscillospiraceae bacterium]
MRKRKPPQTLEAVTFRVGALLLAIWLLCMTALTLLLAQYLFDDLAQSGLNYAEDVVRNSGLEELFDETPDWPGMAESGISRAIAETGRYISVPYYHTYPGMEKTPTVFGNVITHDQCDTAIVVIDRQTGNVLRSSGDFLYFNYVTEEEWKAGTEKSTGHCWISLEDPRFDGLKKDYPISGYMDYMDVEAIRVTGWWAGSRFEPVSLALMTWEEYYAALNRVDPDWEQGEMEADSAADSDWEEGSTSDSGGSSEPPYTRSQLDSMGVVKWDVQLEETAPPGRELVTLYGSYPRTSYYQELDPVTYGGQTYNNLRDLLLTKADRFGAGRNNIYMEDSQFDLWESIIFSSWGAWEEGNLFEGYTVLTALRASPLDLAMRFLKEAYFATFLLAVIGLLLVRRSIRKNLTDPLRELVMAGEKNWHPTSSEFALRWQEPRKLQQQYKKTIDQLRADKNEISRLQTALDYARHAERNRRQMTSHIAHELKTPLAVIHSYAEGLQEHIAEGKREKYLQVILSEAERTDAMVLELLDLSRLEAGKVKLAREEFSLPRLTRSIFEKLERPMQEKQLQLQLQLPEECTVNWDEGRIGQVIENFATNAVKYTPVGGNILVKIETDHRGTIFTVENDSVPFTKEQLQKVWETFYRTDEARSGGGTGLGLAIAKSIVELHGGKCAVRNTRTGVAFSFTI